MPGRGFTLLELLFTLTTMALLLAVGLPSLSHQIQKNRTKSAALELYSAVQLTRNTAVSTNKRATMRHLGSWQEGWEVFIDENDNGIREEEESLLTHNNIPFRNVTITGNRPVQSYISFTGTGASRRASGNPGGAFLAGTIKVCPVGDGQGYKLILSRGGRMRIQSAKAKDCGG